MRCVFVASSLDAATPYDYELCIRRAEEIANKILELGGAPIAPQTTLRFQQANVEDKTILTYLLSTAVISHAVFIDPQYDRDTDEFVEGVISLADSLGIPVIHSWYMLELWLEVENVKLESVIKALEDQVKKDVN